LLDQLREFGLQHDIVERAFLRFAIDAELVNGRVRLTFTREQIAESDEKLFALPNIFSESSCGYAEFLDHISGLRIKYLNSMHNFTQQLTIDELEDEVRESMDSGQMGQGSVHIFREIVGILEYRPAGYEDIDDDAEESRNETEDLRDDLGIINGR
jgi:hypothetical protein